MKRKKYKMAVVGVYGDGPDFTTGQAVKCRELIDWMAKKYGMDQIRIVNTWRWKRRSWKLFSSFLGAFLNCETVIIMPAPNGIKIFGPLSYYFQKIFNKKVHYVVIGGWLADLLNADPFMKKCVKAYAGVYAETPYMVERLKDAGLLNCFYMPNFRTLCDEVPSKPAVWEKPLRICTYSRVVKEKGIGDAVRIVLRANEIAGRQLFFLDVYGKIDASYESEFEALMKENQNIALYCGVRHADEGIMTLASYFALLFPSWYEGEGLAGTILDAFASQTPVLANDWKYIHDIIEHGENGLIYGFRDIEEAAGLLNVLYEDNRLYKRIQAGCAGSAKRYSTDAVLGEFTGKIFADEQSDGIC